MAGMHLLYPQRLSIRYVSYRHGRAQSSKSRREAARVRFRTLAAVRLGSKFRQRLARTVAAVRHRIWGACSRSWGYGCSEVAPAPWYLGHLPLRKGQRPRFDERHDLGERTRAFLSWKKERRSNVPSICYHLSLRMIPSNTARRVQLMKLLSIG
jgi:hypothetical protein